MVQSINTGGPSRAQAAGPLTRRSMLATGLAAGSGIALAAAIGTAHAADGMSTTRGMRRTPMGRPLTRL